MEWLTSFEVMERLGYYSTTNTGRHSLGSVVNYMKDTYGLPETDAKKVGGQNFYSSAILDDENVKNYLKRRAKILKGRRHDIVSSEEEQAAVQAAAMPYSEDKPAPVELTEKTLEEYDVPYSKAEQDYNEFCVKAMEVYLHDWEEQVDYIVKRLSYIYSGDSSSVPRILHELHDDVERYTGVSFENLKNGKEDSSIKCIRRDKRLQYYFLRSAREMALKNGVIYVETA